MFKFLVLFLLTVASGYAQVPCDQNWEDLPVQHQGRVKPYLVVANETIKNLTGKSSVEDMPATKAFCLLSFSYLQDPNMQLAAPVEHEKLRQLLKVDDSGKIPYSQLGEHNDLLRAEYAAQKLNNSYKKAINSLMIKKQYYDATIAGSLWTIPIKTNEGMIWHGLSDVIKTESLSQTSQRLTQAKADFIEKESDHYLIELTYQKSHIFSIAMLLALLSIFITVMVKNIKAGVIASIIVIAVEIAGITMRVMVSGRAPITNMYETVMFSGFGALIIALFITIWKRDKIYILSGLGYNTLCLFMMKFSGGMLDESISPLVPVLRDNFWLSTHVTTIILSYAALALSWMLANVALFKERFSSLSSKDRTYYIDLIYTSIKVGVVLLAAGIILGGVWADYSWGRFWGWDPKETWSLIVLLFYMAMLHGKNTPWVTPKRFINLAAFGFLTVMMAWFGVNYILAAGLHSYGFSEGGAIFLGAFFAIQIIFIIICNIKFKSHVETN